MRSSGGDSDAVGDSEAREAFVVSRSERELSTAERAETTDARVVTTIERAEDSGRRDEHATLRDIQASDRDRVAELRDRSSEERERGVGDRGVASAATRAATAADRSRAAEDRVRAAEDRRRAGEDRAEAKLELAKAHLDDLTGFHRLALGKVILQRGIDRSRRFSEDLTFVYCDLDRLKRVNDEQGHAVGDRLLRQMADAIRSRLRCYETVVRVGGNEFVCALSQTSLEQAGRIFDDIGNAFEHGADGASMSCGTAALQPDDTLATFMDRSDAALREAKSGSN